MSVVALCMRDREQTHKLGQAAATPWPKQQVPVAGHQAITEQLNLRLAIAGLDQNLGERLIVLGLVEDGHSPDAPVQDVIDVAPGRDAFGSGHQGSVTTDELAVKRLPTPFLPGGVDPSGLDWHHLGTKDVFDPNDSGSYLNELELTLDDGIDIHCQEYGWELNQEDHTRKGGVHSISNQTGETWESAQRRWLREMKAAGHTHITKEMFDNHIEDMKRRYGLVDELGNVLKGAEVDCNYPDRSRHLRKLRNAGRLVGGSVGKRIWIFAAAGAFSEAAHAGASPEQAAGAAAAELANPLPVTTQEVTDAASRARETANRAADRAAGNVQRARLRAVDNDTRNAVVDQLNDGFNSKSAAQQRRLREIQEEFLRLRQKRTNLYHNLNTARRLGNNQDLIEQYEQQYNQTINEIEQLMEEKQGILLHNAPVIR